MRTPKPVMVDFPKGGIRVEGTFVPEPSGTCQNCGKRPGTTKWVGEGGTMALIHGMYSWWCGICCVEAQLDYARKQAALIPEREAELAKLLAAETASVTDPAKSPLPASTPLPPSTPFPGAGGAR